jgi:5-methylcytosine-specific restriction endonuclease McrA
MHDDRDWNDKKYVDWRIAVYKRDKFFCQMPNCPLKKTDKAKKKMQAHHIKRWADFPELRFQISNGITLCKHCHKVVEGQEEAYEQLFMTIVSRKNNSSKTNSGMEAFQKARNLLYGNFDDEGSLPAYPKDKE